VASEPEVEVVVSPEPVPEVWPPALPASCGSTLPCANSPKEGEGGVSGLVLSCCVVLCCVLVMVMVMLCCVVLCSL